MYSSFKYSKGIRNYSSKDLSFGSINLKKGLITVLYSFTFVEETENLISLF